MCVHSYQRVFTLLLPYFQRTLTTSDLNDCKDYIHQTQVANILYKPFSLTLLVLLLPGFLRTFFTPFLIGSAKIRTSFILPKILLIIFNFLSAGTGICRRAFPPVFS